MGDAAVNLVRAIVSYIQQRSTTMTGPSLDRLISSQCQACVSHLRGSDLSHDDANQILGVLREERCLFNTEQVDTISVVLDEKLTYTTSSSHQPHVSLKQHQQTHINTQKATRKKQQAIGNKRKRQILDMCLPEI